MDSGVVSDTNVAPQDCDVDSANTLTTIVWIGALVKMLLDI